MILEGIPCPNLESLKAEFTCLYGRTPQSGTEKIKHEISVTNRVLPSRLTPYLEINDSSDREFRSFVRRKILAAIKQAIGRLRANRRPDEELIIYILGDYPLDFPVELVKASDITPEAASKMEQFEMALRKAAAQLQAEGKKVTQTALSKITGYSQGYISRQRKLLLLLLDNLNSKSNNPEHPPEVVRWTAREMLPLARNEELIEEVLQFWEVMGDHAVPARRADRNLLLLFELLPNRVKQDLLYWLLATQPTEVVTQWAEVIWDDF